MNIFLASFEILERPAKISAALRFKGHKTFLMYVVEPKDEKIKKEFDFTFKVNDTNQVLFLLDSLAAKFIHIFSRDSDPLAYFLVSSKKTKTIYDYKDIFEGLIKIKYPESTYKGQKYLVLNSDYVCNRDFQILPYKRIFGISNIKSIYFPDLVWPNPKGQTFNFNFNNIRLGKKIRLVLIGNFTIEKISPEWSGLGYLLIIMELLKQGFEVHIYPNTPEARNAEAFSEYLDLARLDQNFIIHDTLNPLDLRHELRQYDFGLQLMQGYHFKDLEKYTEDCVEKFGTASRCMDYIGAGVPIIYSNCFKVTGHLNARYKFGIALNKKELFSLREIILKEKFEDLKKQTLLASVYFLNAERWIWKLEKLYLKLLGT